MDLHIKKLHPGAILPSFAHAHDAGLDLRTVAEVTVLPGERVQIATGLAIGIPVGHVGLIWDKSGLSQKKGLKTLGGVIDVGYRGEVYVGLYNTSTERYTFAAGDKIAQLLIQAILQPEIIEVLELDDSDRGTDGFGSTGT